MGTSESTKLKIDGIKLSPELVQIAFFPESGTAVPRLFHDLASRRINLTMVTLQPEEGRSFCSVTFCLGLEDLLRAQPILDASAGTMKIRTSVGSITVFPHGTRLGLLEKLLAGFAEKRLPVYGMASSLSTLTFITDFPRLDEAVIAVRELAEVPVNHAPFRPEFRVRQL